MVAYQSSGLVSMSKSTWKSLVRISTLKWTHHAKHRAGLRHINRKAVQIIFRSAKVLSIRKEHRQYDNGRTLPAFLVSIPWKDARIDMWVVYHQAENMLLLTTILQCPLYGRGFLNMDLYQSLTVQSV